MSKSINITIDVQKVRAWASHGETSEEIASKLGITVDELNSNLSDLAAKNRRSASAIRQLLANNDKATKPSRRAQAHTPKAAPQVDIKPASSRSSLAAADTAPAKPTQEAQPPTRRTVSVEVESLQQQIERSESNLARINAEQEAARQAITASKQTALEYEQAFRELLKKLESYKTIFEAETQKVKDAEETLIACEGQRTMETKRLAELKAKLETAAKPEIYICGDEIQAENVTFPETIDTSGWAQLITALPEEIGSELRKKDAELLIRLRAITCNITRKDLELAFENDQLEKAYAAMLTLEN